ncbi:MAG: hypothetical protein ACOCT9_01760 [archaeon]
MPVQLKRKKEIKKGIQDYFFEYVLDCKNKYQISSLLKEAVEETLIDKLNYIDREDFLFLTDDKEEMEFINEHLAELIYEISDITGVWAIFVQHLCSDGRFKHPLTSYYIGEDSEGCISYVITGDGDPYIDYDISYSSVFESLLEDLGMKHPDRAMKAIKNYIKENEKTLKEYEGNIWGIEIDPDENYVVINSSRDQFDLIPDSCLKEISTEYYDTGMDTILYYKKKGRFIKISISRYQGSPDYVAKIAKIKGEDMNCYY